ncbi:DUF2637 domain-containing protein [Streptomyces xantholiticus]
MTSPSPPNSATRAGAESNNPRLTRLHWILIGVVVAGAVVIAAIGFSGSYAAVRDLAEKRGFGDFAPFFPIGIDVGIIVLLALDLLLTWIRIPFPLLRQTAWLLTAATIAFNGAAAWPDPLGVGMHAVIPVLFIVAIEAARHAIGRIADLTADKHMEGVRFSRWLLSPVPTFRLWRRMKLWELRSYEHVVRLEQDRLVYQARLRARFGRAWRRKAPVDAMTPLRLAKYGVPLRQTGPAGLAAAGITTPAVFFADVAGVAEEPADNRTDNEMVLADKTRTSIRQDSSLSAPADSGADMMSAAGARATDMPLDRATASASSGRMSATRVEGFGGVLADNAGHPQHSDNLHVRAPHTETVVRPALAKRPLAATTLATLSAPDIERADNVAGGSDADKSTDNASRGADNSVDDAAADKGTADKSRAGKPKPDNASADKSGADNGADKKPPRGAIANGVRSQLAVGVRDAAVITERLTEALGMSVDKKTVARVLRREQSAATSPKPPEEGNGPYL